MSDIREASVETSTERLPGGPLGQWGPFLVLAAGALWLRSLWDELPARLPVHWNWRGDPDRWVARSPSGASTPLLLGGVICLLTLALQLGIRYGAPRASARPLTLKLLLAGEYFAAATCCGVLAAMVTGGRLLAPVMILVFAGVLALLVATIVIVVKAPPAPARNPAAWRAGVFYVDADDPAILVPKRYGVGYTFNFGHPISILITFAILVIPLLIALFALSAR